MCLRPVNSYASYRSYMSYGEQPITTCSDPDVIEYFTKKSKENGIPHQTLINQYLQNCRARHRELKMTWEP